MQFGHGRSKLSEEFREFLNKYIFLQCEVVSLMLNPQAGGPLLSAVYDCTFNIFAANLHICRSTPPSATQGMRHAVATGTHGWIIIIIIIIIIDYFQYKIYIAYFIMDRNRIVRLLLRGPSSR